MQRSNLIRATSGLRYWWILGFMLVMQAFPSAAQKAAFTYNYDENCLLAYRYEMSMHFAEAHQILATEKIASPNNLMAVYLADYEDCLTFVINCDKHEYEKRKDHFEERLTLLEKGDENSPWFRFCKAGLYMHWAIAGLQFGDQLKAAARFRKSYFLLKENERLFPNFEYDAIFSGLQESVVGALPGNYQWMAGLFGIKGNIKKGNNQLAIFVAGHNSTQPFFEEAELYFLYTRFYLGGEHKEAWDQISGPSFATHDNPLRIYAKTTMAIDHRRADAALATLKDAENGTTFEQYPIFYYLTGVAMLSKSDIGCISYFQQYLKLNKSDLFTKTTWQRMAYAWYLAGNMEQANYCRLQARNEGAARIDADKQAEQFGEGKEWPVKNLLRGRLLSDGGYYQEAFKVLSEINLPSLTDPADRTEYFYRLGRIYQELSDNKRALEYYNYALAAGKKRHEQYAARAALQMGLLYEHTGATVHARASFQECLDMPSHDFQNIIDQQAKAGLNRMEDPDKK